MTQILRLGEAYLVDKKANKWVEAFPFDFISMDKKSADDGTELGPDDFTITGSTEDVDRDGDIIRVAGWDLKNFQKGGSILWAHNYTAPPVARPLKTEKDTDNLKLNFLVRFATEEFEFAKIIRNLVAGKYIRASSVGFVPTKWKDRVEESQTENRPSRYLGREFMKQELLELSIVPVPSNPHALIQARSKGVCTADELIRFENFCKDTAPWYWPIPLTPDVDTKDVTTHDLMHDQIVEDVVMRVKDELTLELQDVAARLQRGIVKEVNRLALATEDERVLIQDAVHDLACEIRSMAETFELNGASAPDPDGQEPGGDAESKVHDLWSEVSDVLGEVNEDLG